MANVRYRLTDYSFIELLNQGISGTIIDTLQSIKNVGYETKTNFIAALDTETGAGDRATHEVNLLEYGRSILGIVTTAGNNLLAIKQGAGEDLIITGIKISDMDVGGRDPYEPDQALTTQTQIVAEYSPITHQGYISDDAVLWAQYLDNTEGPYTMTQVCWYAQLTPGDDIIFAIEHMPPFYKMKKGAQNGNNKRLSFILEYAGVKGLTKITIPVETWALDFSYQIKTVQVNANAYTDQKITDLVGGADSAFDTLKEIQTELENDDSLVGALTSTVATETTNRTNADVALQTQMDARPRDNLLINGNFDVWQRGTLFNSVTTPNNGTLEYMADRWILMQEVADTVDISLENGSHTFSDSQNAWTFDVQTANEKFGMLQIIEGVHCQSSLGGSVSLSFQAKRESSNVTLNTFKAAVLVWDGTEDHISEYLTAWNGAGTIPGFISGWTFENTPTDLTLTSSYQKFTIENIDVDTLNAKNLIVFIWCDEKDSTVGDKAYFTQVKLEEGSVATPWKSQRISEEEQDCFRYFYCLAKGGYQWLGMGVHVWNSSIYIPITYPVPMRVLPTLSSSERMYDYRLSKHGQYDYFSSFDNIIYPNNRGGYLQSSYDMDGTEGDTGIVTTYSIYSYVFFDAEL